MIKITLSFRKVGFKQFQNLLEGGSTLLYNVLYLDNLLLKEIHLFIGYRHPRIYDIPYHSSRITGDAAVNVEEHG